MNYDEAARVKITFGSKCFDWPLRRVIGENISYFWWLAKRAKRLNPEIREAVDTLAADPEIQKRLATFEKHRQRKHHRRFDEFDEWALR